MTWTLAGVILAVAALVRLGASSLTRTARADAMRAAVEGDRGARVAERLLEDRDGTVQAVAVVHSALLVMATLSAVWAVSQTESGVIRGVVLAIVAVVVVAVGDLLPRVLGRARPGRIGFRLSRLVAPVVAIGSVVTDVVAPDEEEEDHHDPSEEEEIHERQMISSVLEFSETLVREVMVPRTEVVVLSEGAGFDRLIDLVNEHGFSRIPVIDDGIDDVVGIVIVKDLLKRLAAGSETQEALTGSVEEIMRPAMFVPETKRVSELLQEMQQSKIHFAVVIDEYGSTAGVVTIEDLLEELVGEIVDEYDDEEPLFSELGDGHWLVDGRFDIDELSDLIGVELPDEDWDTVGGLLLGLAGRVPKERERFHVAGVELTVASLQGRWVTAVQVERRQASEGPLGVAG